MERYRPGLEVEGLERLTARVRTTVDDLERGTPIRFMRSTIVPADESVLCIIEAASKELVREAVLPRRLSVRAISAAIDQGGQP